MASGLLVFSSFLIVIHAVLVVGAHSESPIIQLPHDHHHHHHRHGQKKHGGGHHAHIKQQGLVNVTSLFVFGDSYANTGNIGAAEQAYASKSPYGSTFPGKPTGRWSDGKIMPDFVAEILGIPSPIAYENRDQNKSLVQYGMNFAYGGTGAFAAFALTPTLAKQIDNFKKLIKDGVYGSGLEHSIALVSYAGNDYTKYLTQHNGTTKDLGNFAEAIVRRVARNVRSLRELGIGKIALTTMPPSGCLPIWTQTLKFESCLPEWNQRATFHNQKLRNAVIKIPNVVILDTYTSMTSLAQGEYKDKLNPCCLGVTPITMCGSVDASGKPLYAVCSDPDSRIFWDIYHPTQAGWAAIISNLRPSIEQLKSS